MQRYSEVFWERYKEIEGLQNLIIRTKALLNNLEIPDWERQMVKIVEAEKQHAKNLRMSEMIKAAVAKYRHPLQQLSITYPIQSRTKTYSEEEDRFLVCALARHGVGSDDVFDRIKREILEYPGFRFDWFIKSRTPVEVGRRCATLISLVQKEHAPEDAKLDPVRKARGPRKKPGEGGDLGSDPVTSKKREANGDTGSDAGLTGPPPKKRLSTGGSRSSTPISKSASRVK